MMEIIDSKHGKRGYGAVIYPVNLVIWLLGNLIVTYMATSFILKNERNVIAFLTFGLGLTLTLWFFLGIIRSNFQCFKVIQRAIIVESVIGVRTFSRVVDEVEISNITAIKGFLVKPAISLYSDRKPNYIIELVDGRKYAISAGVEGAEEFLEEIHRINPNIEFSLKDRSLRNHWTLERI